MEYLVMLLRIFVPFRTNIYACVCVYIHVRALVCAEASQSRVYSFQTFPPWVNLPLAASGRPVISMVIPQIDCKESDGGPIILLASILVKSEAEVICTCN